MTEGIYQLISGILAGVGSGIAVYVGIKVDLAVTRYKAERAQETADAAHRRLDNCIQGSNCDR